MKIIGIYKITSPSGRIYIGQSRNFKSRCSDYKSLDKVVKQRRLYNSYVKYGVENHKIEFIEECLFEKLNIVERKWQDYYDVTSKNGLNCVLVGTEEKPYVMTEESKLKISAAHKGKIMSLETREKLSKSHTGKKLSEEHILKISKGSKIAKKVIDTLTNEIYNSAAELALILNINRKSFNNKLSGRKKNNTQYQYLIPNGNGKGLAFESNHITPNFKKQVINIKTSEIFESLKDAAISLNMKRSTLNAQLLGQNKNSTNLIYL